MEIKMETRLNTRMGLTIFQEPSEGPRERLGEGCSPPVPGSSRSTCQGIPSGACWEWAPAQAFPKWGAGSREQPLRVALGGGPRSWHSPH